ncbi:MAG: hypothetical protein A4E65_00792 [Syntrophorhabdus sp. PtaU1.Bin153]|nr:MAG: hypothetical protein A4E65_00792 [Syntrophorhabdus sp. PtaU1.Bin153]
MRCDMPYEWKTYGASITVPDHGLNQYGLVHRKGAIHIRNYRRPLKKGGMTMSDLVAFYYERELRSVIKQLYARWACA